MTRTQLPVPAAPLSQAQRAAIESLVRRTAKAEILPRFGRLAQDQISSKSSPEDLVTKADTAAEAMLTRGLQQLFPHALIVGEEAVARDPALRGKIAEAELAFIIDPVDGTWNFAHALPLFGVILAATRFGRPVFGMIYDPVQDDWITAVEDGPAELRHPRRAPRQVSVSRGGALHEMRGFIHLFLLPEEKRAATAALFPRFGKAYTLHCSCHEYRTLARGSADFHISGTLNPWDHAAGTLIVERAGGVVRMMDGQPYSAALTEGYLLIAPNEESWESLRNTFAYLAE